MSYFRKQQNEIEDSDKKNTISNIKKGDTFVENLIPDLKSINFDTCEKFELSDYSANDTTMSSCYIEECSISLSQSEIEVEEFDFCEKKSTYHYIEKNLKSALSDLEIEDKQN